MGMEENLDRMEKGEKVEPEFLKSIESQDSTCSFCNKRYYKETPIQFAIPYSKFCYKCSVKIFMEGE